MTGLFAALQPPPLDWVLVTGVTLVLAVTLSWSWERFCRLIWAFGLDERRTMAFSVAPVRFLLLTAAWAAIAMPPWSTESRLDRWLPAAVLTGLATLWALPHAWDVVGGLRLAIARSFTVGDQVATPSVSGQVVLLGLTKVRIRSPSGAIVDVPARELATSTVHIAARRGGALPVRVEVDLPPSQDPDILIEALREHAMLSAYCDASQVVLVELVDARTASLTATPVRPDDRDELRSDLVGRARSLHRLDAPAESIETSS